MKAIYELKEIDIWSVAKIAGVLGTLMGIMMGLFYGAMIGFILSAWTMIFDATLNATNTGTIPPPHIPSAIGGGLIGLIIGPIVFGIMFGVGGLANGALGALTYNIFAKWMGGLKLTLSNTEKNTRENIHSAHKGELE